MKPERPYAPDGWDRLLRFLLGAVFGAVVFGAFLLDLLFRTVPSDLAVVVCCGSGAVLSGLGAMLAGDRFWHWIAEQFHDYRRSGRL